MNFRAIWPIVDETTGIRDLIAAAEADLPLLLAQAHAAITDNTRGRWSIVPSVNVPGSGRITENVLMFEVPARAVPVRAYRKAS